MIFSKPGFGSCRIGTKEGLGTVRKFPNYILIDTQTPSTSKWTVNAWVLRESSCVVPAKNTSGECDRLSSIHRHWVVLSKILDCGFDCGAIGFWAVWGFLDWDFCLYRVFVGILRIWLCDISFATWFFRKLVSPSFKRSIEVENNICEQLRRVYCSNLSSDRMKLKYYDLSHDSSPRQHWSSVKSSHIDVHMPTFSRDLETL